MKKLKNNFNRLWVIAEPVLKERSRAYFMLVIVIIALIVNGLSISVIGTLCLRASEPIWDLLFYYGNSLGLYLYGFAPAGITLSHMSLLIPLVPSKEEFSDNQKLNPYFITGFSDAESSFGVGVCKHANLKTGNDVNVSFKIHLHTKDLELLNKL